MLEGHVHDLDERITELRRMRADVRGLRERAATLDPAACAEDDVCHVIKTPQLL